MRTSMVLGIFFIVIGLLLVFVSRYELKDSEKTYALRPVGENRYLVVVRWGTYALPMSEPQSLDDATRMAEWYRDYDQRKPELKKQDQQKKAKIADAMKHPAGPDIEVLED